MKIIKIGNIPIDRVVPNPFVPRVIVANLDELAASISSHGGLIQPVSVREKNGLYELAAGHRRWLACKQLGYREILAIVDDISDEKMLEIALVENIQRNDFNPLEEARCLAILRDTYRRTQEQIAEKMGKTRDYIAQRLRLLTFRAEIQDLVSRDIISVSVAETIASAPQNIQNQVISRIYEGWQPTVRELKEYIASLEKPKEPRSTTKGQHRRTGPAEKPEFYWDTWDELPTKPVKVIFGVREIPGYIKPEVFQIYRWLRTKGYGGTLADLFQEATETVLKYYGHSVGIFKNPSE